MRYFQLLGNRSLWWGHAERCPFLIVCAALLGLSTGQVKADPPADLDESTYNEVRKLLNSKDYGHPSRLLEAMGKSNNGYYARILSDPMAGSKEITRIIGLIQRQKGDRSQFVHIAANLAGHKEDCVRLCAADLLGDIGTSEHASVLAPLLFDEDANVQRYASSALVKIGTAKEVEAFDRRISTKHAADTEYPDLIEEMTKRREALKKRLEADKKKK